MTHNAQEHTRTRKSTPRKKAMSCELCPALTKSRKQIVRGEIHSLSPTDQPRVMVIAEAPGKEEDKSGHPLTGISGQEARHHLNINGISRLGVWMDNITHCHPEGNRDPTVEEINNCTETNLIPTILRFQPEWIITMGRLSTRFFLGNVNLEMVHGIPRTINFYGIDLVVIPTYHPAAGLHSPELQILFQADMRIAGNVIKGEIPSNPPEDEWEDNEKYTQTDEYFNMKSSMVAIDTEWAREKPYCLSLSVTPGEAHVVMDGQTPALSALNATVNYRDTIAIVHNALYDLPVLSAMGIHPQKVADTMVMAYLLQDEPQGLKPLAFRHCGMEMDSYQDMVGETTREKTIAYLEKVMEMEWPNPSPVLEWKKGEPHVRQPQNIKRKVGRVLSSIENGKDIDPYSSWKKMDGREHVEDVLGVLLEADLSDIPNAKAVYYSARDADATIRIFPVLWKRICSLGLEDTFWRDMAALPMVIDMMANGMPVSIPAFQSLSDYFQSKMDLIQRKMQITIGHLLEGKAVNPASYPQMSTLIYDKLELHLKGGKFKSKKGAVNKSTAGDILKRYIHLHPSVQDIMDWREYQKLKTSYADAIPRLVSPDGRIRTTLRITRVATGRLSSSKPNLMAQPTRSSEGRKVRDCYVAEEGNVLLSGDYSQVEMRVAANDSRDETMIEIFWRGEDIHAITASRMFGVPISQLDEMKHRYPAKRVGFGILNLITAEGLQRELTVGGAEGWSISDCEEMIKSWFSIYQGIAAYMKANGEQAKRYGYIRDMWGRIRYIPGIRSVNRWARIEAERQAGNAPIQSGAQGIIKDAMGRLVPVYRELNKIGTVKPLIQIHDDIIWEIDKNILLLAAEQIKKEMEIIVHPDFVVPLPVDLKCGKKWGSMKKLRV